MVNGRFAFLTRLLGGLRGNVRCSL